jgi:hypothetical protein
MDDKMILVESNELQDNIAVIMRQTNYTETEAMDQLKLFNYDHIKVIKKYLGIDEKVTNKQGVNPNQEIYKQMRFKLDNAMRNYNERKAHNETKLK